MTIRFSDTTDHTPMRAFRRPNRSPHEHTPPTTPRTQDNPDDSLRLPDSEEAGNEDRPEKIAPTDANAPSPKASAKDMILPPIPLDHLNRDGFGISDQPRIAALFADLDFTEAESRREQIAVACKHLREFEGASRFTFDAIGRLFSLKGPSIEAQWKKSQQAVRGPGRPPLLPPEVQAWMTDLITTRFRERNPITYAELLDTLQYTREITLSGDSLRHIVRGMPTVKSVIGVPTESERVSVDPGEIEAWFNKLEEKVQGIPRAFVFNVDETGCSEYSDSREVRALVPIDYPAPSVPVPVNRHSKRSTLTACIAADGFRAKPFLIVSRATAENELRLYGYDRNNVFIASQENAFMTRSLFELWATEVFFPMIEQRRTERNYQGKVLLLMDGLGSHHTDLFLEQCAARGQCTLPGSARLGPDPATGPLDLRPDEAAIFGIQVPAADEPAIQSGGPDPWCMVRGE
jgi:hypothetical protein